MDGFKQAIPDCGYDLLGQLSGSDLFDDCIVLCAPESWEMTESQFPKGPKEIAVPKSMELKEIDSQVNGLPDAGTVFGIGGGTACDAAKMYAWRRGSRLVLVPTILSVDAPFTKSIGIRVNGRVRYVGEVFPEYLLVDLGLIQQAPNRLNRAGVGDILSIFTALFDWKLAAEHNGDVYEGKIARLALGLLERMSEGGEQIRECTEGGLRLLSDLYASEVELCELMGNSRPEEGSEHYFAYCLEYCTQKRYLHGELIALAVVLTGIYQGQPVEDIVKWLDWVGVEFRPESIGISRDEIIKALVSLPEYLEQELQLEYGIYHHKRMTERNALQLIELFNQHI